MVMNMKRFITGSENEQARFDGLRGTSHFMDVIKNDWGTRTSPNGVFSLADEVKQTLNTKDQMSTEQVGYSTGIFRSFILEQQTFPTYIVNKEAVFFPENLKNNYQFSKLFLNQWKNWDIYIRPVYTGLFVLRLLRKYERPRMLLNLAKDVNQLQESFDVQSAHNWLLKIRESQTLKFTEKQAKEDSIQVLLDWLGSDGEKGEEIQYLPVQSKIAMEVAGLFVEEIAKEIRMSNESNIQLRQPLPRVSVPLHDSYVIYHIDNLFVNKALKKKRNDDEKINSLTQKSHVDTLEHISVESVKDHFPVQQQICNLLEGAVLKPFSVENNNSTSGDTIRERFPILSKESVTEAMTKNLSSWADELCLIRTSVAIFFPSKKYRNYQLLVTTLSRSTSHIKYIRYWGAVERMVEFVLSIRVLAQLLERLSYSLLGKITEEMHKIRSELLKGDIKMNGRELTRLISEAANLQRLASLCQGLSDPHVWSRAEYGIVKAQRLIDEFGIPLALEHIQRNLDAINQLGNHIDELYLGDLAEKNNNLSFWSSLGLAGISLILTILILPSFWADINQIGATLPTALIDFLDVIESVGNVLAGLLIFIALILVLWAIPNLIRAKQIGHFFLKKIKILFKQ
jgi:hypothetical protein